MRFGLYWGYIDQRTSYEFSGNRPVASIPALYYPPSPFPSTLRPYYQKSLSSHSSPRLFPPAIPSKGFSKSLVMSEYKIIRLLGEGSFGKCYLCEHLRDHSQVVIKEINLQALSDQERKEALGEAKVLEALKHTNIITFREVYKTRQNKLCIVMDFADGGDLAGKVKAQRGAPFPENQLLDWFIQIALALKHVHDRKVLHRDIKTQNVFLMKNGTVKVGDFGIAKVLKTTKEIARTMVGTPYYLSPEIIENKPYSFKSDVWSMGVLLYELCALRPPFDAAGLPQLYMKIVRGNYAPIPPQYSRDLKGLVGQMLLTDVGRRPTINQILRMPFIKTRISNYLSRSESEAEFNHTVLHNQYLFAPREEGKRDLPRRVEDPPRQFDLPRRPDIDIAKRLEDPLRRIEPDPPRRVEPEPPRRIDPEPVRRIEPEVPKVEPIRRVEPEPVRRLEPEPLRRQESDQIKPKPAEIKPLRWREEGEARNLLSPRYELRPEAKAVVYQPPKALAVPSDRPSAAVFVPPKREPWEKPSKLLEEQRRKKEQEEAEQLRKQQESSRLKVEKEEKRKAEHAKMLEDRKRIAKPEKPEVQIVWPGMREEDKLQQELVREMKEVLDEEEDPEVPEPLLPHIGEEEDRNDIVEVEAAEPEPAEPLEQSPSAGIEGLRGYLADLLGEAVFEGCYKLLREADPSRGRGEVDLRSVSSLLKGVDPSTHRSNLQLIHTLIYIESLSEQRAAL